MSGDRRPLPERMRPAVLDDVVGQDHLVGPDGTLRNALAAGHLRSLVFWGPPGTGKTTLARLVAGAAGLPFHGLSAVTAGLKDLRAAFADASPDSPVVIFLDEIHRFNKAQQDALLPVVEAGSVVLIGATTENPSFEINRALLSRVQIYVVKALEADSILKLLRRAVDRSFPDLSLSEVASERLVALADGDARRALQLLEAACASAAAESADVIELGHVESSLGTAMRAFDRGGDLFYEQISALHKSVRGSDPDAAIYWFARMLDGGCDPLYIGRRLVRMASEDLGNADPRALTIAIDACSAFERLGSPEGDLALAQAVLYLASAPKSNAAYTAFKSAMDEVRQSGSLEVPMHLRNAPTGMMKSMGFGAGYRYDHDEAGAHAAGQTFLPDGIRRRRFYEPRDSGLETKIAERLARLRGGAR
ncbi:replication-associated recombination protein A [Abyssibacter sp.]|uniref:replication-associated recombination protein A n=1 Tax=Abyssibacter sp. TaxID=2320200 RepID=UPI0025C3ACB2|nr:replication-associated recombination protein A [Abyssibacter sp.]MCK5859856.1 replication-associated recombination protein A [Abyssibacter sp.]